MPQLYPRDVERILQKSGEGRYRYFVKTVCEEEEVWGLADEEGWLMLEEEDDESKDALVVFPNPEFAALFKEKGDYEEFQVECLDLYEFVDWLEDFEEQKLNVAVFPTPELQCAIMTPERLKEDFQAEFDKETE